MLAFHLKLTGSCLLGLWVQPELPQARRLTKNRSEPGPLTIVGPGAKCRSDPGRRWPWDPELTSYACCAGPAFFLRSPRRWIGAARHHAGSRVKASDTLRSLPREDQATLSRQDAAFPCMHCMCRKSARLLIPRRRSLELHSPWPSPLR